MSRMEKRWGVEGLKYGFVYRWTDRGSDRSVGRPGNKAKKRKRSVRYYVGSHWGHFDDGYVCSSPSMKAAYRRRPEDFSRRIIAVVTTGKRDLLQREQLELDKIPRSHFGTKAYNVSTKVHKLWWAKGSKLRDSVKARLREAWQNPERREEASRVASARRASPEQKAKMSRSARRRWRDPEERRKQSEVKKGCKPWNAGTKGVVVAWNKGTKRPALTKKHRAKIAASLTGRSRSKETRRSLSSGARKRWQSEEYRAKISASRAAVRARGGLKITPRQAARVRELHATKKYTLARLADKFGVSRSYVHGVLHDPKWDAAVSN